MRGSVRLSSGWSWAPCSPSRSPSCGATSVAATEEPTRGWWLLAAAGFVAVYLVPFAAYPANPPGVGNDETIGERTGAYLTITLLSVGFAIAAAVLGLWLVGKLGGLLAAISAGAFYVVAVAISIVVLPSYNDVPTALTDGNEILFDGFPAATLADFRFYSVINQVVLWTVLGIVFTLALTRIARRANISTPESALVS